MAVLVGKKAPSFSADAVVNGGEFVEGFSLDQYMGKKYVLLFFYPADFTFVCPTEIISFQESMEEFEKRDVAVIGCSTDSKFSHWKWLTTEQKDGGIQGVKYPLVADPALTIAENYDVLIGSYEYSDDGEVSFNGLAEGYPCHTIRHSAHTTTFAFCSPQFCDGNCSRRSSPLPSGRHM